jgi:hypothetical protein
MHPLLMKGHNGMLKAITGRTDQAVEHSLGTTLAKIGDDVQDAVDRYAPGVGMP